MVIRYHNFEDNVQCDIETQKRSNFPEILFPFLINELSIQMNDQMHIQYNQNIQMQNYLDNQSIEVNQSLQYEVIFNQESLIKKKKLRRGRWTKQQQIFYYSQIKQNFTNLKQSSNKRVTRVFKTIAQRMKTRQSQQVRTHHQKMMKKYRTLENLLFQLEIQYFEDKTAIKQLQQKIVQITKYIQKQEESSHIQTTTTIHPQEEDFFFNKLDDILSIPIRLEEEQYLFGNYIKQWNSENDQLFLFD